MEERNIKVSISKAREWYKYGNSTLKELALQAFTKDELETLSIEQVIIELLSKGELRKNLSTVQRNQLEALRGRSSSHISAPKMLRILAAYFNSDWKKTVGNTGYFFAKKEWGGYMCNNSINEDWGIIKHESVCYPLAYFSNERDCITNF